MNIGFAGAGAVGCHYGSKLQQAGADVLLLARGAHLQAMLSHGLKHESGGICCETAIAATGDMARLHTCSVLVLSCKMTGLKAMLDALQGHIAEDTLLVTLQNGVEAPDMVAAIFPDHAIVAGTAFIGARLEQPGYVMHTAAGGIRMGLWQRGDGERNIADLMGAFHLAGVPARMDDDPEAMLWRKLLWNCGFNALTAITRRYAREMAAHGDTLDIVQQAMAETVALAQARGIGIDAADIAKHIEVTLAMGPVKTSMWQDIEAGHKTEVDFLNGYVAAESASMHLASPANQWLTTLVKAIEAE